MMKGWVGDEKVICVGYGNLAGFGLCLTGCSNSNTPASTPGTSTPETTTSTPGTTPDSDTPDNGDGDSGTNIVRKDEIVYATPYIIYKLDPQYGAGMWEWAPNRSIYDSLFRAPKMDYYNCIPWLAESYEISDDGLDWTFYIRQGVKFHDGSELTADDVIFTLERSKISPYTAPGLESVESFEKVDDYTVIMHQSYSFPSIIPVLADYQWAICNKNAIETYGEGAQEAVVGTGPYKLVEWSDDNSVVLEYFEDYWAEEPDIKKVTFRPIPDYNTAAIAMRSGEIDVLNYGLATDMLEFAASGEYEMADFYRNHSQGVTMNNRVAPFDDIRVRKAINHAIDKESVNIMTEEGANDATIVAKTPREAEGYALAEEKGLLVSYEYDVEKAKALLAEAGYDENNPLNVPYITPSSTFAVNFASAVQDQLARVNINIDVQVMEAATWVAKVGEADFVMSFNDTGVMPYWSPLSYKHQYGTGQIYNRENTDIPRVNEILALGQQEMDADKRAELYAELLNIVTEEAICCPVFYKRGFVVSVKGLKVYPESVIMPIAVYDMEWID